MSSEEGDREGFLGKLDGLSRTVEDVFLSLPWECEVGGTARDYHDSSHEGGHVCLTSERSFKSGYENGRGVVYHIDVEVSCRGGYTLEGTGAVGERDLSYFGLEGLSFAAEAVFSEIGEAGVYDDTLGEFEGEGVEKGSIEVLDQDSYVASYTSRTGVLFEVTVQRTFLGRDELDPHSIDLDDDLEGLDE